MKTNKEATEQLNTILKEIEEKQAAKSAKIAKMAEQKAVAESALAAAVEKYDKAKESLNASAMIRTGTEKRQAEDVLQMFTDALAEAEQDNPFTNDEILEKHEEFSKLNNDLNRKANEAICKLLSEIEAIINQTSSANADLNTTFESINNNSMHCGYLQVSTLVSNMANEIRFTRQQFPEYWPK